MLVGLFRWREARSSDVWKLLWNQVCLSATTGIDMDVEQLLQGLIWVALATVAEVPTVVFVWLNLNRAHAALLLSYRLC